MLEELYRLESERIASLGDEVEGDKAHPVFGDGNANDPVIMFIGEAPGREEAACGRPFVGKAGRQLDEMLELAGIDRGRVFVTNAVKYRPTKTKNGHVSNRTPKEFEVRAGLCLLEKEIGLVKPLVLATLGNVPLSALMLLGGGGEKLTVGDAHGRPASIFVSRQAFRLFPLYHPAASIYNRSLKPVLEEDLKTLGEYCRRIKQ